MNVFETSPRRNAAVGRSVDICRWALGGPGRSALCSRVLRSPNRRPRRQRRLPPPRCPRRRATRRGALGRRGRSNAAKIAELTERIERGEQERQTSVSPADLERLRRLRLLRPASATAASAGFATPGNMRQFPQYSQLLLDVPGRHPVDRGQHARRGGGPGRRARRIPRFDSVNSDGAAGFILNEINLRPRYQLSDNAILRASVNFVPRTRIGLRAGRLRRRRPGRARVPADPRRQDVDLRRQDDAGVRHRVQGAQVRPALRHHAVADRPLHDRAAARASRSAASCSTTG